MKNIIIKIIGSLALITMLGFGTYYFLKVGSENTILKDVPDTVQQVTDSNDTNIAEPKIEKKEVKKQEIIVANGAYEYSQNNKWLIVRDSFMFEGERFKGDLVVFDKVNMKVKTQIPNILSFAIISNEGIEENASSYSNQNGDKILISEYYDLEPSQLYDTNGDYNPVPNQDKLNKLEEQLGFSIDGQVRAFGGKPVLGVGMIYVLDLNTLEKTFVRLGGYQGFKNTKKGIVLVNDINLENPAVPVNRWFNPFNNVNSFSYGHVSDFVELNYSPKIVSGKNTEDTFGKWEIREVEGFKYKLFY